jgi:hypothetical protein
MKKHSFKNPQTVPEEREVAISNAYPIPAKEYREKLASLIEKIKNVQVNIGKNDARSTGHFADLGRTLAATVEGLEHMCADIEELEYLTTDQQIEIEGVIRSVHKLVGAEVSILEYILEQQLTNKEYRFKTTREHFAEFVMDLAGKHDLDYMWMVYKFFITTAQSQS